MSSFPSQQNATATETPVFEPSELTELGDLQSETKGGMPAGPDISGYTS